MDYLQHILDSSLKKKDLFGISLSVYDDKTHWSGVSGNLSLNDSYFIASTSKLFTSSLVFKLRKAGKLEFRDPISKFLPSSILRNLHSYKGKEYSNQITVSNLLAHTSGLPDYFKNKSVGNTTLERHLTEGNDMQWDLQQVIEWNKQMTPAFSPSKPNKAYYSDTNYQLLGKIIENQFEDPLAEIIQEEICKPLELNQTYLYTDPLDTKPRKMYFKSDPLNIPKAMTSFKADGGVVSTSEDLMKFIQGFMIGKLFPRTYIQEIQQWNKIFFPLESGVGIHRFKAPWYFSPFRKIPELIGHSGLSGAFAFYVPKMETYLTGTVNQIHNPGIAYTLLLKILIELKKKSNG